MPAPLTKGDALALGAAAVALVFVLWAGTSEAAPAEKESDKLPPEPGRGPAKPRQPPPGEGIAIGEPPPDGTRPVHGPRDTDDETALARMLVSEDPTEPVWVVVGWLAVQWAQRRRLSVYKMLTGKSGEYGGQEHAGETRYASTAKDPTQRSREVARALLAGQVRPAAAIRAHGHSPWVEWRRPRLTPAEQKLFAPALLSPDKAKQTGPALGPEEKARLAGEAQRLLAERNNAEALKVLRHQAPEGADGKRGNFGGIWGRIKGTRWFLYDPRAPRITFDERPGGAVAALEAVPQFDALDADSYTAQKVA